MIDAHRLPQITAALVLEAVSLEVFRDQHGMFQCASRGIGPRRKKLGPPAEDPEEFSADPFEKARDEARQVLAGMCRTCPFHTCRFKDWGKR